MKRILSFAFVTAIGFALGLFAVPLVLADPQVDMPPLVTDAGIVDAEAAPPMDAPVEVPAVAVDPESGSATSTDGAVDTLPELKTAYEDLKSKYAAYKAATPGEKTVLLALFLAALLKLALDGVNLASKFRWKKALGWVALGLAVPIFVCTYYATSRSWISALILAAAGPGSVVVNELLKTLRKGTSTSAPDAAEA